jgi:hypothetical protein
MEGGPFLSKAVQKEFARFVEIVLHTDGPEANRRNRDFQRERFETVALPYYVLMDPDGTRVYWQGGGRYGAQDFAEILRKAPAPR